MARRQTKKQIAAAVDAAAKAQEEVKLFKPINADGSCGVVRGNQVVHQDVEWLVEGWIPLACSTLVGGPSEVGKSTFFAALAAQVAGGRAMIKDPWWKPHTVLWYTAEESVANVVGPRLSIAGCPLEWVGYPCHGKSGNLTRRLSLPADLQRLKETITSERAMLVVMDPVTSFLSTDCSPLDNGMVRRLVEGIDDVCRTTGASVCMTLHDRKSKEGSTVDHFAGAAAWTQTPRVVLRLGKDSVQEDRYVILTELNRLGPKSKPRYYALEKVKSGVVFRMGEETQVKSADLGTAPVTLVERGALAEAKDFLNSVLKEGPVRTTAIQLLAQQDGLSWMTVRRAKEELRVIVVRTPCDGTHYTQWSLATVQKPSK
jgi:putative DNA primase/helicase